MTFNQIYFLFNQEGDTSLFEFIFYKTQLESNVFDNFHEIRFKIDEYRERLKKRIDQTKKSEAIYSKSFISVTFP
jgi:hypothetical protein